MTEVAPEPTSDHDDVNVLRNVTWADYERLLEVRGESGAPRFVYCEGLLEIMTPSRSHESVKSVIGRLVEVWCLERGVEISAYGAWTIKDKRVDRGAEADECYVVGDVAEPERPDLVIEVEWSRHRIDKLEVWRKLGARELWIWRRGAIAVHVLRGERYEAREQSELLPGIDLAKLASFIDVRPMTRAIRAYRDALAQSAPRT